MKNKKILLVSLLALLASCGDNVSDNASADVDTESSTFTLQIFTGGYGSSGWQYALSEFEKLYGDQYTIVATMDNNVNTAFADRWQNGNPPDFVFLDGSGIDKENWLREGLLKDLSTWLETAKVQGSNTLIKDAVDSSYWLKYTNSDNKTITYGAPLVLNAYGMWYDQTLFDQKKWTFPNNYDELKAFASNATKEIKSMIFPGTAAGYLTQGLLVPAFAELDDNTFDRIMNCRDADVYTSSAFKEVLTRFQDYIALNDNTVSECLSMDHTKSQMQWLAHDAAMIPNGLWLRSEMAKLNAIPDNFNMHFAPSPLVKNQQTIVTSSIACGIANQAKNSKAAKEFISLLYREDVQKQFVYATDSPSVISLDLENDPNVTDVLKYTQEVFNNPNYIHKANNGSWGGVDSAINEEVKKIVKAHLEGTDYSVDSACQAIKKAAEAELEDRAA